eukprot:m.4005 g.4005  ORF g.4005 m.4005 type:complete len:975 (+) comp2877_c0_seq1:110-3034(+)
MLQFTLLYSCLATAAQPDTAVVEICSGDKEQVITFAGNNICAQDDNKCLSSYCNWEGNKLGCYPAQFETNISQAWSYDEATKRFVSMTNKSNCLDLQAGGKGAVAGIYDCDGLPSQQWSIDSEHKTIKTMAFPALGSRCITNPLPPSGPFLVDRHGLADTFHGLGAISGGGATSRLLVDYPAEQQEQILDYLFKPNFGASLQMLKVEIGGDLLTTDGSESSHMHDNETVDLRAGYEWWLMTEAKKRNPDIKLYGLPWAYPGWVGINPQTGEINSTATPFDYPEQTVRYMLEWVKGAKSEYGLDIDYLGIWNESPSNANYVKLLRSTLDSSGFEFTRIVARDGGADICNDLAADPEYAKAVDIIGLHYPSDFFDLSNCHNLGKPVWASEESSSYDDLNGAACWARVVHSHYALSGITSSIMWNLLGAYYPGTSWYASSMLTANQPWSGWYGVRGAGTQTTQMPVVWSTAHVTQFTKVGWQYLKSGMGSGLLLKGGFYTTIADPNTTDFTIHVVKISFDHAPCTRPSLPDSEKSVFAENVTFFLAPSMGNISTLKLWRSNFEMEVPILFEAQPDVHVVDGRITILVNIGDYMTVSTITTANKGNFSQQVPQPQPRSPIPIEDDFNNVSVSQQPRLWSQMTGSWEVQIDSQNTSNKVLRQTGLHTPLSTWGGRNSMIPVTIVGMREWQDVSIRARFRLPSPSVNASACLASRVDWTISVGVVLCVQGNGEWTVTYGGDHRDQPISSGKLPSIPVANEWHVLNLTTLANMSWGYYDTEHVLFSELSIREIDYGFAAMATTDYIPTEFDDVKVDPVGPFWNPNPVPPSACLPQSGSLLNHELSVRHCQQNGITAPDENFMLYPDWRLVHAESGLCATATSRTSGSSVTLQHCNSSSELQLWKNDYSNIHHGNVPLTLQALNLSLVGSLDGSVRTQPLGWSHKGDWNTWTFFDSTGQLRNQRTARDVAFPVKCLSLCPDV